MKLRRYIALTLISVYLFAVGGPAVVSLTCKCVAMHTRTAQQCCLHHDHEHDPLAAKTDLWAPCCGNHHSTQIALYTGSGSDNDRQLRCASYDLPPQLAVSRWTPDEPLTTCERLAEERLFLPEGEFLPHAGLRAPPVLA